MSHKNLSRLIWILILIGSVATTSFAVEEERSEAYYHYLLGSLKERNRDYGEAIQQYRQALEHDPQATEIFARLADLYVQTNRVDEAVKEAENAIRQNADNKEAHRMLGEIYMEKMYATESNPQDIVNAIREFQEVRRIDPDDETIFLPLGQLYLQNNDPKAAADLLVRYLEVEPESQVAMMSLATAYQQLNQPDKAMEYLLKYAELNPNNFYVVQQIADTLAKTGDVTRALEFQKRAYEYDSDNPTVVRKYIDLLGKNQRYQEAIQLLEVRIKEDPSKLEWVTMLARVLQKSGNQEQAESMITERIRNHPGDLDLSLALVQVYEEGDKFEAAFQELERMLTFVEKDETMIERERKANLALIYSHMGYSAQQLKDFDRSLKFYKKAREFVEPEDTKKIDFYIALGYRGQKRWDEAIATLNGILKVDTNDTDAWELLSIVYEDKGDTENSDKVVQYLIDAHPNSPQYYLLKAERLQRREDYAGSIAYLKDLLPRFPENEQVLFLLGAGSERLKQHDEAEDYFKRVIAKSPQNADALNYLGYMLIDSGIRLEEAIDYVKRALEIDRNNGAYLDSLGWGYFKLERLDLAEDNLRQALQSLPDNAVVHDHVGDLYFKQGKFRQAIEQWQKALDNKNNEIDPQYIQKKIDDTKNRLP